MKYSLPISIILHLFLFIASQLSPQSKEGTKGAGKNKEEQILPAQVTEVTMVERTPGPSVKKIQKQKKFKSKTICSHNSWFGGIGIQIDESRKVIDIVYPGYPADKVGLLAEDVIILTDGEIRGEPGTTLSMSIFRPSTKESLLFNIIRDRICYGERKR